MVKNEDKKDFFVEDDEVDYIIQNNIDKNRDVQINTFI